MTLQNKNVETFKNTENCFWKWERESKGRNKKMRSKSGKLKNSKKKRQQQKKKKKKKKERKESRRKYKTYTKSFLLKKKK